MRFTRDRWYSREGLRRLEHRARSESIGTRRIISLALLLLMILVVMQQLNDPKKYGPAFRAIGLTQPSQSTASASNRSMAHPASFATEKPGSEKKQAASEATEEHPWLLGELSINPLTSNVAQYMQMWLRLFDKLPLELLNDFARNEFGPDWDKGPSMDRPPSVPSSPSQSTLEWLDIAQSRVEAWQKAYQSMIDSSPTPSSTDNVDLEWGTNFVQQWSAWENLQRKGISAASTALDPELRRGLRLALDRRLLELIRDAAPWRVQERPTLARTLQRATIFSAAIDSDAAMRSFLNEASPRVEVTSLMRQADAYRGRMIRFHGRPVTTPEPTVQEIEGWGRFEYDIVWLRPDDDSQQPVCLYALRKLEAGWPEIALPDSNASSQISTEEIDAADGPLVEVTGMLVKRLAYPSQRGVDVAPILIALDVRRLTGDEMFDHTALPTAKVPELRSQRWIEPGEQAANLELLREIFASELDELTGASTRSDLKDLSLSKDLDQEAPQLGQILYQLSHVTKPLSAAIATRQKIGPAQLSIFQGWVRSVEAIQLRESVSDSGEPGTIFRLSVEPLSIEPTDMPPKGRASQTAFVNQVPDAWKKSVSLSQPITFSGLYWEALADDQRKRIWMADHVHWTWPWLAEASLLDEPAISNEGSETQRKTSKSPEAFEPTIPDDWRALGALGFDLSYFDLLKQLRGQTLTASESQAFYSLIDCGSRWPKAWLRTEKPDFTAIDCLDEKNRALLRRVRAKVHIVRATRILVTDEDDQSSLDGDAYYQLDGLANMGDLSIQMKSPDAQESILFQGEYPITLLAKELPIWLIAADVDAAASSGKSSTSMQIDPAPIPSTWYPRTTVEIEGVFYRLWSFSTAQTSAIPRTGEQAEAPMRQIGPLVTVVGWEKLIDHDDSSSNRSLVRELVTAIGLSAIGIYGLYRLNRSSKRRKA